MKKNILLFVFEGYADWEVAYATAGIVRSDRYHLKTLAIDKTLKRSSGGTRMLPDLDFFPETDLKDIDKSTTAMLILPGGTAWDDGENLVVADLIRHCIRQQIPVAASGEATFFLAHLGLLNNIEHTSIDLNVLRHISPTYRGECNYVTQPSVRGEGLITTSGAAPVEFAKDVFNVLGISPHKKTMQWFQYFEKAGV